MSGVEAAGLVLAAIPLVVVFLEDYGRGMATINRWRKYDRELKSLCRRLRSQEQLFRNSCELLLQRIVSSEEEMERLVSNPLGDEWRNKHLEEKIQAKLARSYSSFIEVVEDVHDAMAEFKNRLGMDGNEQVQQESENPFKAHLKRARFSLTRSRFDDLIDRIEKNNDVLSHLISQSNTLEPSRQAMKSKSEAKFFKEIRQFAEALFESINSSLRSCRESHNVCLRIFPRKQRGNAYDTSQYVKDLDFPVVISHATGTVKSGKSPILWSEINLRLHTQEPDPRSVQISPVSTNTSLEKQQSARRVMFSSSTETTLMSHSEIRVNNSTTSQIINLNSATQTSQISTLSTSLTMKERQTQIHDLCSQLQTWQASTSGECLGLLPGTSKEFQILSLQSQSSDKSSWALISLRSILLEKGTTRQALLYGDRLRIAVAVASSVLQLHGTNWLQGCWSNGDVFFIQRQNQDLYEHTFISKHLDCAKPSDLEDQGSDLALLFIRNATIFALGIMLIELCLGKSIQELRVPEDSTFSADTPNELRDFYTADRVIKSSEWSKQASIRYQSAVKRCLYCNFNQEDMRLEDDGFRQAVYEGVVVPLEKDLMAFEGTGLPS